MIYIVSVFMFAFSVAASLEITPTKRLHQSVDFRDDLDFEKIETAIKRQLSFYERPTSLRGQIRFGTEIYNKTILRDSLEELRMLAARHRVCLASGEKHCCEEEMNREINASFHIYVPNLLTAPLTRFTAYYSPDLRGSKIPTEKSQKPIYGKPSGALATKYTRVEIDHDRKLSGKNLELFWVENSFFDIYLLHVQGGGRITLENPDGTTDIRYLSMTGHNGKKCEFIGHHMARLGWLPRPEALRVSRQREFLEAYPQKNREAFRYCQNYIFFRESTEEPVGRNNIPLTEGRSVAVDHTLYPTTGLITFVKVNTGSKMISRFFLAQDTGSKIRGPARSDLYMGYGPEAETTAYSLHRDGEQYFLVKRKN